MILTGRARERYVARAVRRAVLNARLRALSAGRPVLVTAHRVRVEDQHRRWEVVGR